MTAPLVYITGASSGIGQALALRFHAAGYRLALVARRAEKLTIPELHQGVMDKLTVIREMAARHGLSLKQVAYIGDDVNDLEALKAVGFSASPADGLPDIVAAVDYVCRKKGGEGAVREIIEMILEAQQHRPR